jgi:hypothetical protein
MSAEPVSQYPAAATWAQVPAAVGGALRRLPATLAYLGVLGVVALVMSQLDSDAANRLVRAASTNLDNLRSGDVSTLFTSAFVVTEPPSLTSWILLAAVMTGAELLWGTWRAIGAFLAGHIGATLLVAGGLTVGISHGWTSPAVASAADVGISYGLMGLVGAVTAMFPPAIRPLWALSWLAGAVGSVVVTGGFTSVGHLCALTIGLAIAAVTLLRTRHTTVPVTAMPRIAP